MTEPNGLYYMRARYYDPNVGRFISEDPIGFDGGDVNLYAYVLNNPILLIDPWGMCAEGGFWNTVGTMGNGFMQAGQGLFYSLGNEDLQRGTAQGFIMAGKVAALVHTAAAVEAYLLFDVATVGPFTTAVVNTFLTNPQGSLDVLTSMFPGSLPTPNEYGLIGASVGELLGTGRW